MRKKKSSVYEVTAFPKNYKEENEYCRKVSGKVEKQENSLSF